MKFRKKKRILLLLKKLSDYMEKDDFAQPIIELFSHYNDKELRQIIYYRYSDEWSMKQLNDLSRFELKKIIDGEFLVLLWTIDQLEKEIN